jgi:ABC-type glycerol-3-phosphate transport system permease component
MAAFPVQFWPSNPAWDNFVQAVSVVNFWTYAGNSVFLATAFATLSTLTSALVGFGFARLKGPGKRQLFLLMLSTMMLPSIVTLMPTYVIFADLNLVGTYWPWVLWGLASSPFMVFLYRQFFSAIPVELEEAAIIDGCGYIRIFWRIFLPLSLPVIMTVFLLSFVSVWGDYIGPTLFLSQDNTTLSVAMSAGYADPHGNALINLQAAGALIYIVPEIVVFFFAQRYFVRGIVTSGLKG